MGVVVRRLIDIRTIIINFPYSTCISSFFWQQHPYFFVHLKMFFGHIIESVDSTNRDERGFPWTQYITNWGISRARNTITHFKHHHRVLKLISNLGARRAK